MALIEPVALRSPRWWALTRRWHAVVPVAGTGVRDGDVLRIPIRAFGAWGTTRRHAIARARQLAKECNA